MSGQDSQFAAPRPPGPNPLDIHVGQRMRQRRKLVGLTQDELGDRIGVSFQQVQKYERGSNRISASKLYRIAIALEAPISFFYGDYVPDEVREFEMTRTEFFVHAFLATEEGNELAEAFGRLKPTHRRKIVELVQLLGEGEAVGGGYGARLPCSSLQGRAD